MRQWRKYRWRFHTFSVSAIPEGCRVLNAFTHELGHNLGLIHDRYSYGNGLSLNDDTVYFPNTSYGFGYVNQNFSRSECSLTIMASGRQCLDEGYRGALLEAEQAALDLTDYFDAGADGGALTYAATVDDPDLASISLVGLILTVTANDDGEEGVVTVTATATDQAGETATLRFAVTISPRPPASWRGWRSTLAPPADDA